MRAAGVYALGTFVSSGRERTDHANSIDQQVAVSLAKIAHQDMSPIVRAELLAGWKSFTFHQIFLMFSETLIIYYTYLIRGFYCINIHIMNTRANCNKIFLYSSSMAGVDI